MSTMSGTISLHNLPPNRGLIVSLAFFEVSDRSAPVPYDGDPPGDAITDCVKLLEEVDLDTEYSEPILTRQFQIERSPGFYYLQLRVILFRKSGDRVVAQAEQFFFRDAPVQVDDTAEPTLLKSSWPMIPIDDLNQYGTIAPEPKRPWWRIW